MDMSMHEINVAAETITAAADSDANIIFGATINPDLEGEIIITVVATGFDASYFANRQQTQTPAKDKAADKEEPEEPKADDTVMSDIDTDLDSSDMAARLGDFHDDTNVPNIWTMGDHDSEETQSAPEIVTGGADDELEKPSFLRRLKRRRGGDEDDKKDDSSAENNEDEK
jgi:cell division protein FtsZ